MDGYAYVVSKNTVYRIDSGFASTSLGTISSSVGPVSMDYNPTQLIIVDGVSGYIVTLATGALVEIADSDFPDGADTVTFIDGYFAVNVPNSGRWQISSLNDGTAWDLLEVTTAEGSPDKLVALQNDHRQVWAFGERSTEVYENTGAADFPFERVQYIAAGCASAFSTAKIDNTTIWLGRDHTGEGMVWRADGYLPRRISTHAIEFAIAQYERIDDAIGFAYQQDGHSFYQLTFPTGNATWVYDVAASADFGYAVWHERAYRNASTGRLGRHLANCHFFFFGEHIVGDYRNGNLYALDLDTFTDNEDPRRWLRSWNALDAQSFDPFKLLSVNRLMVDGRVGQGLSTGQGSDPQVMLRISDDGGNTWSSEIWAGTGAAGQYGKRVIFEQLGQGQDVVFELSGSDPVPVAWVGAHMEASYGR